jgi:hypothetical protein
LRARRLGHCHPSRTRYLPADAAGPPSAGCVVETATLIPPSRAARGLARLEDQNLAGRAKGPLVTCACVSFTCPIATFIGL